MNELFIILLITNPVTGIITFMSLLLAVKIVVWFMNNTNKPRNP